MTTDSDAALPYDIPDCHCQHVTGGRCMFAATASPGLDVESVVRILEDMGYNLAAEAFRDRVLARGAAPAADRETP